MSTSLRRLLRIGFTVAASSFSVGLTTPASAWGGCEFGQNFGKDDYFEVSENGSVSGNVLENDHYDCGPPRLQAGQTQLSSGAWLDLKANGDFFYYPNGAFSHLGEGAHAVESFTYPTYQGERAVVTFKVIGATAQERSLLANGPFAVPEFPSNGTLIGVMSVEDTPQSDLRYSLGEQSEYPFYIDSYGRIRVIRGTRLDFEQVTSYPIEVEAIDRSGAVFKAALTVRVRDINPEKVVGGDGPETLYGGDLDDTFYGASGRDTLRGGLGKDTLYGGPGADKFVLSQVADSQWGAKRDVIGDWESVDQIGLFLIDANADLAGRQGFTFVGKGPADLNVRQGQLKYYHESNRTYVVGNVQADGHADFRVEIVGYHTLVPENFVGVSNAILFGSVRDDVLEGTAGDDTFFGGGGRDLMTGRAGADTFVLRRGSESRVGPERDIVQDWGDTDMIGVALMDADTSVDGKQKFNFRGRQGINADVPAGAIQYFHFKENTFVAGGFDKDSLPEFQVQLKGLHALTEANFKGLE